jgi:DNA-binding XRE family transcriptional regulator
VNQENTADAESMARNTPGILMVHDIVDGKAIHRLRRQFGLTPLQMARTAGLTEAQVVELEEGGHAHFKSPEHKIRAALKLATTLSGVQDNGLPKVNVFNAGKPRRIMGSKPPRIPAPKPEWRPVKYEETPEFYKMLLLIFATSFILVAVVMPILFGTESPPRVEKIASPKP